MCGTEWCTFETFTQREMKEEKQKQNTRIVYISVQVCSAVDFLFSAIRVPSVWPKRPRWTQQDDFKTYKIKYMLLMRLYIQLNVKDGSPSNDTIDPLLHVHYVCIGIIVLSGF